MEKERKGLEGGEMGANGRREEGRGKPNDEFGHGIKNFRLGGRKEERVEPSPPSNFPPRKLRRGYVGRKTNPPPPPPPPPPSPNRIPIKVS